MCTLMQTFFCEGSPRIFQVNNATNDSKIKLVAELQKLTSRAALNGIFFLFKVVAQTTVPLLPSATNTHSFSTG